MEEILLNVSGMHCEGCEKRIQNVIKDIDGVQEVTANYTDGTVKITANNGIDKKVIKDAIEDIGFEVKTF